MPRSKLAPEPQLISLSSELRATTTEPTHATAAEASVPKKRSCSESEQPLLSDAHVLQLGKYKALLNHS